MWRPSKEEEEVKTEIEWCDWTVNPIVGCSKAGGGCLNCYAAMQASRGMTPAHRLVARGGGWNGKIATQPKQLEALKNLARRKCPLKVFVGSMTDLGHAEHLLEWDLLHDVWEAMAMSPQHAKIILTKRPAAVRAWIKREMELDGITEPPPWLWVLVSIWNQASADLYIPILLDTPAAVRGVSAEPLLESINFEHIGNALFDRRAAIRRAMYGPAALNWDQADATTAYPELGWLIVGGENGSGARAMPPKAARSLRDQAVAANVPFFFKGWGAANNRSWGLKQKSPESRTMDGKRWEQAPPISVGGGNR